MNTERKNYREVQLQKELDQLKQENAKLKDCILLQQKIIDKQKKQKQVLEQEYRTKIDQPYYLRKINRSRNNLDYQEGSQKILKSMTTRDFFENNSIQIFHNQKQVSTKNNTNKTNKTTEDAKDQGIKIRKQKKKVLAVDFKDLDLLNISGSSTNLYTPSSTRNSNRKKSYLQKLADKIADDDQL